MTERAEKPVATEAERASPYTSKQRAYLVTLHRPKTPEDVPFVTVQASHCNQSRRFDDLLSAFRYLAASSVGPDVAESGVSHPPPQDAVSKKGGGQS